MHKDRKSIGDSGEEGKRELLFNGHTVSIFARWEVIAMDGGHGYTTMWMHLMLITYTIKIWLKCYTYILPLLFFLQDLSFLTKDQTQTLAVKTPSPNHWTT